MAGGPFAFNVTLPGSGAAVTLENEDTDQAIYGGELWIRNTGTVNALIGGSDGSLLFPLNTGDPWFGPLELDEQDMLQAKIASGSSAGQISVLKRTR